MNEPKELTYVSELTAADAGRRIISGKIAPYGEVGYTSAGATIFAAGSLTIEDISKVQLRLEHDKKAPIGKMISASADGAGMYASFKVAATNAGNDALIEASEGLRGGLSVGIEVIDAKRGRDGSLVVTAAKVREVSLVAASAFTTAEVHHVAASEGEKDMTETTPADVTTPAPTEGENQVETTPATTAEAPAPVVEASRPVHVTPATTSPRQKTMTSAEYFRAKVIIAGRGDGWEDLQQAVSHVERDAGKWLSAAKEVHAQGDKFLTAADDSTSTNTGLTLPQHLNEFITNTFNGVRPAVDAISTSPLFDTGMSFTIPRLVTAPAVGTVAEAASVTTTGMTSDYETVNVIKKAGKNRISFELYDRSSPAFYELLMTELKNAYATSVDTDVLNAFIADGTIATATAATAAGLQSFMATESAAAYKGTGGKFAKNLVGSTDVWASVMGMADTTNRPLYFAQGATFNAAGEVKNDSLVGNVLSSNFYVDHNIAASGFINDSAFLVAPQAVKLWESPQTMLRLNVLDTGEIDIELYGYIAIKVLQGAGVRRFNLV